MGVDEIFRVGPHKGKLLCGPTAIIREVAFRIFWAFIRCLSTAWFITESVIRILMTRDEERFSKPPELIILHVWQSCHFCSEKRDALWVMSQLSHVMTYPPSWLAGSSSWLEIQSSQCMSLTLSLEMGGLTDKGILRFPFSVQKRRTRSSKSVFWADKCHLKYILCSWRLQWK